MRSKSLSYMPALDGLRAIAVGMVFVVHAFPEGSFPGGLGVDVFFLISGFLITRILLKELDRTGGIDLRTFYVKRALRLYPALLLVCAVFLVAFFVLRRGIPWEEARFTAIAVTYTSNIWMTVTGEFVGHLTHTWSLAMEEQFYVVWPIAFVLLMRSRLSRRSVAVVVSTVALASLGGWAVVGSEHAFHPLTKAGGLLVGCVVAFLVERRPWQHAGLAHASVAVFTVVLVAESLGVMTREVSLPVVTLTLPFLVLHAAFGQGWLVRALSARWLIHLGVLSYGLYLWHYPILSALTSVGVSGWPGLLIAAALTYAAAATSFRFVERPVLRLKDRVGQRVVAAS
ncbi:acyltransferase [Cellulomonas cellasea]|uniref:Peptidoglycan/LPS O-acetylase OafA/YrhL n=1 Tax=Cellulomonas cellasea TaxID=43670 RepID=A0A7W4UHB3_9CELL|nr:acyltransferase [Cellulomonas cellasea]MBB2924166.1 peptidoglycan/LPS O-acetylase OafA/YrhL [Cellulomonas cellasea]